MSRSKYCFFQHETFAGISVIDITKSRFSHSTIQIMLRYRSPGSSHATFYNTLENILSDDHTVDLFPGDFHIDILNSTNINLQNVLSNYTLLVNEATLVLC